MDRTAHGSQRQEVSAPSADVIGPGSSVLTFFASLGQVAKWQTRTVQVRVSERTWGFNSPLAHSG